MRRLLTVAVLLALGACVAPSAPAPPPPAPAPAPPPAPPPPPPVDWQDRPLSPGDWSYGDRVARFADAVTLRCDVGRRRVSIEVAGAADGPMTVRTSYGDTSRPAAAGRAELAATDPLLEQIAFSRGRFMLAAGGRELVLPTWPEVSRVVEDCR